MHFFKYEIRFLRQTKSNRSKPWIHKPIGIYRILWPRTTSPLKENYCLLFIIIYVSETGAYTAPVFWSAKFAFISLAAPLHYGLFF